MKTIILEEPGRFVAADTELPGAPGPGEALIRIRQVGICGSDLHAYRGRQPFFNYPRILGHELGAEVIELGPDTGDAPVRAGDLCSVEPYMNCGSCIACRAGKTNCCTTLELIGVHRDGGMREQIIVPAAKLHPSATLAAEQLALVETLGIGAHAVDRAALRPGETILVIGAGPIGLSVVQFAQIAGARIVLLELNHDRAEFCRRQFTIDHVIETADNAADELAALPGGDLPTAVFDATGSPASMMASFNYPASGGRLIFVSLVKADLTFFDPEFHRRELTLLATRNALSADFGRIIGLMESGDIDTRPWITHRAPLDGVIDQFESWLDPNERVVKAMVSV